MLKSRRRHSWLYCECGRIEIIAKVSNRGWRQILPGLLLSAVSIALILYLADLRHVGVAFQSLNFFFISGSIAITILWLGVRGVVWRTLLEERASSKQVFLTLNQGYLLNNILPFRLGEVGRAFLLGRKTGLGFWQVLSSIVIERTLDLGMAAGILLLTLPFVIGAEWAKEGSLVAAIIVMTGLIILFFLAQKREMVENRFQSLANRWHVFSRIGGNVIPSFLSGLAVLTNGRRFVKVLIWMGFNWCITIFQFFFLMLAFFPSAQVIWSAFSVGVVSLGISIPTMPGAMGVWELSIVAALSVFELDLSVALAYAITIHLSNYIVTGVIGAYALLKDGESLVGLFRRLSYKTEI
jgi:glycosyltransferase 2 family protein